MIEPSVTETELFPMPHQTVTECLSRAAFWLYEAGRITDPQLPAWDQATPAVRRDWCYRARAACHQGQIDIRRVRVLRIAQTLATADGFVWPACDNKVNRTLPLPAEQIAALVAQIRQDYLHKARLVVIGDGQYLEVLATDEAPELP